MKTKLNQIDSVSRTPLPFPRIKSLIRRCDINNTTTTYYFVVFESVVSVPKQLDFLMFFPQDPNNIDPYVKHLLAYRNCGRSKICIGSPTGCVENMNCNAVVMVRPCVENKCLFQMFANGSKYVAFGLSDDRKMVRLLKKPLVYELYISA